MSGADDRTEATTCEVLSFVGGIYSPGGPIDSYLENTRHKWTNKKGSLAGNSSASCPPRGLT